MTTSTRSTTFGGFGGNAFDDSHIIDVWGPIRQIVVQYGAGVDAIGVCYDNGNFLNHGGTGGNKSTINLAPGEIITKVNFRFGSKLDQITFTSNKGVYGPYGGPGGGPGAIDFEGKALHYIFGRSGGRVDQIGFAYGDPPPALPSTVERSATHGGMGGDPFDDLAASGRLLGKIASIKVRHGNRVDGIAALYEGAATYVHGGGGGGESTFVLDNDEWLVEIRGRSGTSLDQVQFFTNKGRVSPVYGGEGGNAFTERMNDRIIKAFFGRSGKAIDQLGVYFENARPVSAVITSMDFDVDQAKILQMPPVAMMTQLLENATSIPQQIEQDTTVTVANSRTTSVTEENGVSIELSFEEDFKFVTSTFKIGYTYNHSTTTETTEETTTENAFRFSAQVPAKSKVRATCMARMDKFDVPWTATARVTYQDRPEPVTETLHGVATGVQTTALDAKYEPVD